jgi:hypothetical protein
MRIRMRRLYLRPPVIHFMRPVWAVFLFCLTLAAGLVSAQEIDPGDENYSQTVIDQGRGWQLVEISGIDDSTNTPYTDRMYMIKDAIGVANVPLPQFFKDDLISDLAAASDTDDRTFSISARVVDEVMRSIELGKPTDALIAMSESDGDPTLPVSKQGSMLKGSCDDRIIDKSKHFDVNAPLTKTFGIGDGFTGSLALTGSAQVSADGQIRILLKRKKILRILCIPYGVRFQFARVAGNAVIDQGATLSGTINYANPNAREWLIAKPHLFSINFLAGPIPVHIGFNLPITAGFDQGGITGNVTGSITYSGRRSITGYLDYSCTSSSCTGASNFDTTDLGPQPITAGISGRFQPNIYAQVAVRGYLYSEWLAYAQVGVRPYLRGDLWGYYGNNCGDANSDGYFETVDALTFDLDWQLYITAQADTFLTHEWRSNLWSSPRWHVKFWDLLGGEGSTALSPMLSGPSVVPVNAAQNYGARMRPCWPYTESVDYTMDWGDGNPLTPLNGPAATVTNAVHTYTVLGTPTQSLVALRDAHGRNLNTSTTHPVQVALYQGHKGMTWSTIARNGAYSHVGADALTEVYVGDTAATASLPILCLKKDGRPAPTFITFDFYNGWAAGEIRLTAPVQGLSLTSRSVADGICAGTFGAGYRMGEFHDGGGGWTWWGQGTISSFSRFWVAIDDQPANPWD